MKLVIGVQTCNRINFTKEAISSILKCNPDSKNYPWVIADDNSSDGTIEYLNKFEFIKEITSSEHRMGITKTLQRLVNTANKYGDILLYIQNDWRQTRFIDFKAIEVFFLTHSNAGHLQTVKYKGLGKERPSSTANMVNLHTKEKIEAGLPFDFCGEIIISGNFHFCDLPGFTRIDLAMKMFDGRLDESVRIGYMNECGCDNYLLDNQPYRNIDANKRGRTPGRRL